VLKMFQREGPYAMSKLHVQFSKNINTESASQQGKNGGFVRKRPKPVNPETDLKL